MIMHDAQLTVGGLSIIDDGLSRPDAARRLAEDGPNALPSGQHCSWLASVHVDGTAAGTHHV